MDASDRIKQVRLTAGRQVVAVRRVRKIAQDENMPGVVARCDGAEQAAMTQRAGEQTWSVVSKSGTARVDAKALDKTVDGAFFAVEDSCATHERAAKSGITTPQTEAAKVIRDSCIKAGARSLTRANYEDQFAAMQEVATQYAKQEIQDAAKTLGVTAYFDLIISSRADYERAIQQQSREITGRQIGAMRRRSHEELCELIALILSESASDDALRARLLAPIDEQSEALRAQRAASRPTTDLNPDSGDEEDAPTPDDAD